ncbi:RNHCP domain-containing protein [Streptomyces sp. NPDC004311]|uniref:RNHCP domain-containing protein n=1 Tax=Streptomyces sp. NPDC004311 TaxID=3364698 RepID=UPI0036B14B93
MKLEPEVIARSGGEPRHSPVEPANPAPVRGRANGTLRLRVEDPFDSPRSSVISRTTENTGFTCGNCGRTVVRLINGSYRNHCPHCLHSLHVDVSPGDRANDCRALMRPVAVEHHSAKGYMIVHQCTGCGARCRNRMADDPHQGDDLDVVLSLMSAGRPEAGYGKWRRARA